MVKTLSWLGLTTDSVKTIMANGVAGTDGTLFDKTQTGLISEVVATDLTLTDKGASTSQISVTHQLTTAVGNSNTFTEYAVTNGTDTFNRAVKAPIAKTSLNELTVVHTFDFELVT